MGCAAVIVVSLFIFRCTVYVSATLSLRDAVAQNDISRIVPSALRSSDNGTSSYNSSAVDRCYNARDNLTSSNVALLDATRRLNEYNDDEMTQVGTCIDDVLTQGSAASGTSCQYNYRSSNNSQVYRAYAEACIRAQLGGENAGVFVVSQYTIDCQSNSSQTVLFSVSRLNHPCCFIQETLEPSCNLDLLGKDRENYLAAFMVGAVERDLPIKCAVRSSDLVPGKPIRASTMARVGIVVIAALAVIIAGSFVVSQRRQRRIRAVGA
jgi:hypothetical protein